MTTPRMKVAKKEDAYILVDFRDSRYINFLFSTKQENPFQINQKNIIPIDKCPICLINPLTKVVKGCFHSYCALCVSKMEALEMRCPLCSGPLQCYDMDMHLLSMVPSRAVQMQCLMEFAESLSAQNCLFEGCTVVFVLGTVPPLVMEEGAQNSDDPLREFLTVASHVCFPLHNRIIASILRTTKLMRGYSLQYRRHSIRDIRQMVRSL